MIHRPGSQMVVADFLSRPGGEVGWGGSSAGWLPGLSRAVGVCGVGGVVLTSAARESGRAAPGRSSELRKIR